MVTRLPISLLYDRYFAMVVMPMCLPCYQSSNLFFFLGGGVRAASLGQKQTSDEPKQTFLSCLSRPHLFPCIFYSISELAAKGGT